MIESAKLLAKSQFTHGGEASSSILGFYKLLRQWYERIDTKYKLQQLDIHTQSQKTAHARKEGMLHGKNISSYLIGEAVNNYSQFWI